MARVSQVTANLNVRHFKTIAEGLENSGFLTQRKVWEDTMTYIKRPEKNSYRRLKKERRHQVFQTSTLGVVMPELEYEGLIVFDNVMSYIQQGKAKHFGTSL